MDKKNLIRLLEAMRDNAHECHVAFADVNERHMSEHYFGEYDAYGTIINILTNKEYAAKMIHLFCEKGVSADEKVKSYMEANR